MKLLIKKIGLMLAGTIVSGYLSAQSYKEQFDKLLMAGDSTGQAELLNNWQNSNDINPEYYVAYYNYFIHKAKTSGIEIGQNPQGEEFLEITNPDNGENAGYMYESSYYDSLMVVQAVDSLNKGIKLYPSRLDMRFGKIYALGEIQDYQTFTEEIIRVVEQSSVIKSNWLWAFDKPWPDAEERMLSSIQDYQYQLYNVGDDALLVNMKRIAEVVLKYYPKHVPSLSNASISHLVKGEWDEALVYLHRAEKIDPKDYIVLGNIAHAYKSKKDNKKAIKYNELVIKYGDESSKENAQKQIELLKK